MNEHLFYASGELGETGVTLATGEFDFLAPTGLTLVYASFHSSADTALATIQIQDDGSDILAAAIDAATANTAPVEWKSVHFGGTNTPIRIAAGSEVEIDVANFAANQRLEFLLCFLAG
jgi:hypothetical protein